MQHDNICAWILLIIRARKKKKEQQVGSVFWLLFFFSLFWVILRTSKGFGLVCGELRGSGGVFEEEVFFVQQEQGRVELLLLEVSERVRSLSHSFPPTFVFCFWFRFGTLVRGGEEEEGKGFEVQESSSTELRERDCDICQLYYYFFWSSFSGFWFAGLRRHGFSSGEHAYSRG